MDKTMTEQRILLAEYAETGSEEAFRELVSRYMNLVYSSAMRLVDGDCHRAEDVAQRVFTDLARRAGSLSAEVMLGGWLHRRTCHVAATLMRSERRRQRRERQAAEMSALNDKNNHPWFEEIGPILDEAINQLSTPDRTAIMLRFFEGRDLRSVGAALATNEDAAQKRVSRALEKLRALLLSRGVSASAVGLAGVLSTKAVSAAPAGLAASISTAALAGATATSTGMGLVLLKVMAMTNLKIAVGAVIAAGVGTGLMVQYQQQAKLHEENRQLQQQVARLDRLRADNQQMADALAGPDTQESQLAELDRLRREVAGLRQQQPGTAKPGLAQENLSNEAPAKDYFARESYAFAGFADPDSTFQTMMWAGTTGDVKAILNCFPPEARKDELRTQAQEEKAVEVVRRSTSQWSGYRILDRRLFGEDRMVITIFYEAANGGSSLGRVKLRRVGPEWKFDGELGAERPLEPGKIQWSDGVKT